MLVGQLDRCIVKETACGNRWPLSNQSDYEGVVMATSNANKLFSEFKSAKDFDAAVEKEIKRGVTPNNSTRKKADSTVAQWAAKKSYLRNYHKDNQSSIKKRRAEAYRAEMADPKKAAKRREQGRVNAARWRKENPEKAREVHKRADAKPERKQKNNARLRKRYAEDPAYREKVKARQIRIYQNDPSYRQAAIARATAHNRKNAEKRNARLRERYASDPDYRFAVDMRRHIARAFKGKLKSLACEQLLGVSLSDAKQKIESQFDGGMSWSNMGKWHIDHWYPLNKVDRSNPAHCVAVCRIENLQPLWGPENAEKHAKVTPEAKANFLRLVEHYEHIATQT